MKLYLKLALTLSCAFLFPLLSSNGETFTVRVGVGPTGFSFSPKNLTIEAGDTVMWTWIDSNHSTTSGTPGNPDGLWDSGVHDAGFVFTRTFTTAGTFNYFCLPHGACCGMIGSIIVNGSSVDTVDITRAVYTASRKQLTVQATGSDSSAVLTASVTSSGVVLGTLKNNGGGSYSGNFKRVNTNPVNITVTSSLGGSDTADVRVK